ncbi:MFS transporter [Rhizobium halophytocola]|nr:MFS transporter [Rhizobium halophytocola]
MPFPPARVAVSLLFLMNGFLIGSWAPKIPEFAERLDLTESRLGMMLFVFGVGSLVMMPIAGGQLARFGTRRVCQVTTLLFLPALLAVTYANSLTSAVVALFLFGGLTGAMDVAMNANAVEVERSMAKSIMSSCHAFWSLGGLIGAGLGGYLIATLGVVLHALIATALAAMAVLLAWPKIMTDQPHAEDDAPKARLPRTLLPWLIGIVALFGMVPEGAVLDWGAIYLRDELAAPLSHSGLAFAAFALTMAIMRFAGDWVRDRLGAVRTLRICAAFSLVGLLMAGLAPNTVVALIGFALTGIGLSNVVPIAFSAGGNLPGLARGVGLSVVTTFGYAGILFAPSLIGFIAEHSSLSAVYTGLAACIIVIFAFSHLARYADRET